MSRRVDFGLETTLSGRAYLRLIDRLNESGWRTELIYLALPDVEMSRQRVAERVAHGGHDIPAKAIDRRFARSLHNLFTDYAPRASRARCWLNSEEQPRAMFMQQGNEVVVHDVDTHQCLREEAGL